MASIYRKLEGDEVRFVKIQPGAWTDPIQCDLIYLPLPNAEVEVVEAWFSGKLLPALLHQERYDPRQSSTSSSNRSSEESPIATASTAKLPPFVALSYAWGDPNRTEELLLEGQPVQKTVNLIAGLRQLRAMLGDPSRAPPIFGSLNILFWIDALCINQADKAEKSMQVPRIGGIYGAAKLVVAWLGENEEDDEIEEFMSLVNNSSSEEQSMSPLDYSLAIDAMDSAKLARLLHAYRNLSWRPWFERMWVVQEMAMSQGTALLAGSHWCYCRYFTGACSAMIIELVKRPLIDGDARCLVQPTSYFIIARVLSRTIRAIFEQRSTSGPNTPSNTSENEEHEDYDQQLCGYYERLGVGFGASIFSDWSDGARRLFEDPVVAKEYLSTRLLAFVLRAALLSMASEYKATIPHDYLYGILSISGTMIYPRKLAPDYTLRFEEVFHEYSTLILNHTGDLAIVPRTEYKLKGVPSWVPDFRFARAITFNAMDLTQLSVNSNVGVIEDGRVCFTRGVYLGEVMLASDCSRFTESGNRPGIIIHHFDEFLNRSCKEEQLDKHDVLIGALGGIRQKNLSLRRFQAIKIREVYDDCVSKSPSMVDQGSMSYQDILTELSSKIAERPFFVTSQGLMLSLERHDEQPKEGDVLAMLKGADEPWLLRPAVEPDAEEYTLVGACELLYRNTQSNALRDWYPRSMPGYAEGREEFFACNEIREFRLV